MSVVYKKHSVWFQNSGDRRALLQFSVESGIRIIGFKPCFVVTFYGICLGLKMLCFMLLFLFMFCAFDATL